MGAISIIGLVSILLGLFFWYQRSRSRGEMDVDIGRFSGPVWFLLIVFGLFLMIIDQGVGYLHL